MYSKAERSISREVNGWLTEGQALLGLEKIPRLAIGAISTASGELQTGFEEWVEKGKKIGTELGAESVSVSLGIPAGVSLSLTFSLGSKHRASK